MSTCRDGWTDIGDRCVGNSGIVRDRWDDGTFGAVLSCLDLDSELVSWNSYAEWLKISIIIREDYVSNPYLEDCEWTGANKYFGSVWEFYDDDINYNR